MLKPRKSFYLSRGVTPILVSRVLPLKLARQGNKARRGLTTCLNCQNSDMRLDNDQQRPAVQVLRTEYKLLQGSLPDHDFIAVFCNVAGPLLT
jgi:hypothetical protein